jgi:hypothetical protein
MSAIAEYLSSRRIAFDNLHRVSVNNENSISQTDKGALQQLLGLLQRLLCLLAPSDIR